MVSIAVHVRGWSEFAMFHFLVANRPQTHAMNQMNQATGSSCDGFLYPPTNVGMAPANVAICEQIIANTALPVFCHRAIPVKAPMILTHSIDPIVGLPKIREKIVVTQAQAVDAVIRPFSAFSFFIAKKASVSTLPQIAHETGDGTV